MSQHHSDLCHSGGLGAPRRRALVRERLVAGALGYCFLAAVSCSFDARPNNAGLGSNAMANSKWKPPSAAADASPSDAAQDPAKAVLAMAADAMPSSTAVQRGGKDAGTRRMPADAGVPTPAGRAARSMDASAAAQPTRSDAGPRIRDAGTERDARVAAPKSDASVPNMPNNPAPRSEDAGTAPSHCKPGAYAGTFSGSLQLVGVSLSSVTGTVRAELKRDGSGEHLELHNGRVMGVDQDGNRLTVDVTGRINCTTDELEDGKLENGNFHNVGSDADTAFIGSLQGTYSEDPPSLVGTFSVEAKETLVFGGRGTWSLVRGN